MESEDLFPKALESLVAAHTQDISRLKKIIEEKDVKYEKQREKWQKNQQELLDQIEKLKKDKHELRGMQKKAQLLLDKYREQLRSQVNNDKSITIDDQQSEDEASKTDIGQKDVTPSVKAPQLDCYVEIEGMETTSSNNNKKIVTKKTQKIEVIKTKKESDNIPKTDIYKNRDGGLINNTNSQKTAKNENNNTNSQKITKNEDNKKSLKKSSTIDLLDDINATINGTTPDSNNNNKSSLKKRISSEEIVNSAASTKNSTPISDNNKSLKKRKSSEEIANTTTSTKSSTPIPTKTKYNKYTLTPKSTKQKDNSTNDTANVAKRQTDDEDFDGSSPHFADKPIMPSPPVTASTKKFKYVEVVRNKDERAALPAHECDQCQKFYEALGDGYDRSKMVNHCSRHRSRDAKPDTPPDYWQMSFPSSETQDF